MKRIVVCCDGTWNSPENEGVASSNVVRLSHALLPRDGEGNPQIVYYDPGVGTEGGLADKLTGGAFGAGLSLNVREAYRFILNNYEDGDALYFFGFSRGAYTVRSAAGFVRKVGVLQKRHAGQLPEAWRIYRVRAGGADSPEAQAFRQQYSHPEPEKLDLHCVGVWDTVGSLGIPGPLGAIRLPGPLSFLSRKSNGFHDVALSSRVKFGFHAIAVDEKRRFFKPTLWEQNPDATDQVLEQVWFPGVHADIGGGYNEKALADNTLLWMADRAHVAGLDFDQDYLDSICQPDPHGQMHESRTGPYKAIPEYDRPIGRPIPKPEAAYNPPGRTRQSLDDSTERRYAEDETYRPPELAKYKGG
jgi:uncharacterized protein (DUF2235 family)